MTFKNLSWSINYCRCFMTKYRSWLWRLNCNSYDKMTASSFVNEFSFVSIVWKISVCFVYTVLLCRKDLNSALTRKLAEWTAEILMWTCIFMGFVDFCIDAWYYSAKLSECSPSVLIYQQTAWDKTKNYITFVHRYTHLTWVHSSSIG